MHSAGMRISQELDFRLQMCRYQPRTVSLMSVLILRLLRICLFLQGCMCVYSACKFSLWDYQFSNPRQNCHLFLSISILLVFLWLLLFFPSCPYRTFRIGRHKTCLPGLLPSGLLLLLTEPPSRYSYLSLTNFFSYLSRCDVFQDYTTPPIRSLPKHHGEISFQNSDLRLWRTGKMTTSQGGIGTSPRRSLGTRIVNEDAGNHRQPFDASTTSHGSCIDDTASQQTRKDRISNRLRQNSLKLLNLLRGLRNSSNGQMLSRCRLLLTMATSDWRIRG